MLWREVHLFGPCFRQETRRKVEPILKTRIGESGQEKKKKRSEKTKQNKNERNKGAILVRFNWKERSHELIYVVLSIQNYLSGE